MLGPDRRTMTRAQAEAAQIDVGLRNYMLRVYNYMASAVALTGIVAYVVGNSARPCSMPCSAPRSPGW